MGTMKDFFNNKIRFANIPLYGGNQEVLDTNLQYSDGIQMALTHLVKKDDVYAESYRKMSIAGDYIILDNSLIELGGAIKDLSVILDAATLIGAKEIVLPDIFKDGPASTKLTIESAESMPWANKRYNFMGVAQGLSSVDEFLTSFEALVNHELINTIGIPKVMSTIDTPKRKGINRNYILSELHHAGLLDKAKENNTEIHLLGAWTISDLFISPAYFPYIRSLDSVLPNWEALHNVRIESIPAEGRDIRTEGKAVHEDPEQIADQDIVESNIEIVKDWMWNAYDYAYSNESTDTGN